MSAYKEPKGWKRQYATVNALQEPTSLHHTRGKDVTMAFMRVCFFVRYNDAKITLS